MSYLLKSEIGGKVLRAHANRLQRTERALNKTGDPLQDVLLDPLRTFGKRSEVKWRRNAQNGNRERHFKVQLSEEIFSRWISELDLL